MDGDEIHEEWMYLDMIRRLNEERAMSEKSNKQKSTERVERGLRIFNAVTKKNITRSDSALITQLIAADTAEQVAAAIKQFNANRFAAVVGGA